MTMAQSNAGDLAADRACLQLHESNVSVCGRASIADHRTTDKRQQSATKAVIAFDTPERPFVRHPANGCLLAKEN
jgi:hypothetical protein